MLDHPQRPQSPQPELEPYQHHQNRPDPEEPHAGGGPDAVRADPKGHQGGHGAEPVDHHGPHAEEWIGRGGGGQSVRPPDRLASDGLIFNRAYLVSGDAQTATTCSFSL